MPQLPPIDSEQERRPTLWAVTGWTGSIQSVAQLYNRQKLKPSVAGSVPMKKTRFRAALQKAVLASSVGPIRILYEYLYRVIAVLTARTLGRDSAVQAVYLRRGCAKGEIVPGVSDIDLAAIVTPYSRDAVRRILAVYDRFKRVWPILDETIDIYDESSFHRNVDRMAHRYRLAEGKETWKLLYGDDFLGDIPSLTIADMAGSIYRELQYWWALYSWQLLASHEARREPFRRNAISYKTVSELLKVRLALIGGELEFSRSRALKKARTGADEATGQLLGRLESVARGRFLKRDEALVDEMGGFALNSVDNVHRELRSSPYFYSSHQAGFRVECYRRHWYWPSTREKYVEGLVDRVESRWSGSLRGAYIGKSFQLDINDFAFLLDIEGPRPTVTDLADLREFHLSSGDPDVLRIHIYLLLESCAVQIDSTPQRGQAQAIGSGVLSPLTSPDLYVLMTQKEYLFAGEVRSELPLTGWTPHLAELAREFRLLQCEKLADHPAVLAHGIFSIFMRALQVMLLESSARQGEALYALTPDSIKEALEGRGMSPPVNLMRLLDWNDSGYQALSHDVSIAAEAAEWIRSLDGELSGGG